MLEKSNEKLPYSLALLWRHATSGVPSVIGHSRLCKVHGSSNACFVESGKSGHTAKW